MNNSGEYRATHITASIVGPPGSFAGKASYTSRGRPQNAVMQLNHPVLEAFHAVQIQGHVTMTPRDQWNPSPMNTGAT